MMGEYKCTSYCAASGVKYLKAVPARATSFVYKMLDGRLLVHRNRILFPSIQVILIVLEIAVLYVKSFTNSCSIAGGGFK